jgi:Flp pilus assembly protein TadG
LRGRVKEETGAVAIIVALFMVALLVLAALVLDLGSLYGHDRELQSAADAGALAGAQELVYSNGSSAAAKTAATNYVSLNAAKSSVNEANVAWPNGGPQVGSRSVTVDLLENHVPFSFARVIGRTEGSVKAHAKAEVKYLTGVGSAFPVAMLVMTPEKFRFVFKKSGVTLGSFEVTDPDKDGVYDQGGGTLPSSAAPGLYTVTLQAVSTILGEETVVLELPDIGRWWVSDPSDPNEKLYRVGMSKDGSAIRVRATVSDSVLNASPLITSLSASLGGAAFQLSRQSDGSFYGSVSAPTDTDSNSGYGVHELVISFPKIDKDKATSVTCGAYVAFHPDVPLISVMMTPSFFEGYSRKGGEHGLQSAEVVVRTYHIGDPYVMRLSNESKSGPLYSGNWRLADLYQEGSATIERVIAATTPDPGWHLTYPLVINGELEPKPGNMGNPVYKGLNDRLENNTVPADDPRRVVIVPQCLYDPDLHGRSRNYIITGFAAFRITDYSKKGDVIGEFVRWVAPGTWSDKPPGPLYVETAVLTE